VRRGVGLLNEASGGIQHGELNALFGFAERQMHVVRRYWVWEVVWLFYSLVSVLSIGFLASGLDSLGLGGGAFDLRRAQLYLLVGALLWGYLSLVFMEAAYGIAWERWEGTIEYTFMAPVPRLTHLAGMCAATLVRALAFSVAILGAVALFVPVDLSSANVPSALALLAMGAFAFIGLAIGSACFPLLWTEKGLQMAYIVQAVVLLVSGVYYPVAVLPGWMQVLSVISPATYVIRGMRAALMDGADIGTLWSEVWPALVVGALSIPLGLRLFVAVERYAKRTGRLKRSG